ncbi:MAG: 16S rRNA (guanine(966)-N(2))-methyltransferase RsmD [Deltaproteobacteria bacterium]|nr:16S rRNA (guanine(966)-N(2))-methyltransferase RsmD [Deltaproteobacteria bacterium]
MRILAGEARGRPIKAPRGWATRPTAARMRGAIFDRLAPLLAGCRVLDLFAGTGALGLEALSRGAARATFVEESAGVVRVLRESIMALGFAGRATVLSLPVARALPRLKGQSFQLVLMDAPYGGGELAPALAGLIRFALIDPEGWIVAVHGVREPEPLPPPGWCVVDGRRFGDSLVTTYRHGGEGRPA